MEIANVDDDEKQNCFHKIDASVLLKYLHTLLKYLFILIIVSFTHWDKVNTKKSRLWYTKSKEII